MKGRPSKPVPDKVTLNRRLARMLAGVPKKPRGKNGPLYKWKKLKPVLEGQIDLIGEIPHRDKAAVRRFLDQLSEYLSKLDESSIDSEN